MTTPSSVVFLEEGGGGAIGRYDFLHNQRGTTFIQSHALVHDASRSTVDNIEQAKGEWRDVPMCVRDTILRLMRSNTKHPQQPEQFVEDVQSRRSGSYQMTAPLSARGAAPTQHYGSHQGHHREPLSARGDRSRPTSMALAERSSSSQRSNRISFISSEGLPHRRRTPSGPTAASQQRRPERLPVYDQQSSGHVPHLSPMVERVLAKSSQQVSPHRDHLGHLPSTASPPRSVSPGVAAAVKSHNNSPFGGHHPYESPERGRAGPGYTQHQQHHDPMLGDLQAQPRVVTPRRSPVNRPPHQPTLLQGHWKPAGVVQPYESTEPFGTNHSDGRNVPGARSQPKQQRALALSNLMTLHRGIEKMKSDQETFLASQVMAAMIQAGPKRHATTPANAGGGASTSPRRTGVPTEGQKKALDDVGYLLKALSEASVELVAQFASEEEKRYLGLHSHKYQTRAERQSAYQYTAPGGSGVERKLKLPGGGQRLPPASYTEHIAREAAKFQEDHHRGFGSPTFGPGATGESPQQPPQRLPKALQSPVRSPRSTTPAVPQRHSSSGSVRRSGNTTREPSNDFVANGNAASAADAGTHDGSDSTTLTSTNDQLKVTVPPSKRSSAPLVPPPPPAANPQLPASATKSMPPPAAAAPHGGDAPVVVEASPVLPPPPQTAPPPMPDPARGSAIAKQKKELEVDDSDDSSSSSSSSSSSEGKGVVQLLSRRRPSPHANVKGATSAPVIRVAQQQVPAPPAFQPQPAVVAQQAPALQPPRSTDASQAAQEAAPSNVRLVKRLVPAPMGLHNVVAAPAARTGSSSVVSPVAPPTPPSMETATRQPAATTKSFLPAQHLSASAPLSAPIKRPPSTRSLGPTPISPNDTATPLAATTSTDRAPSASSQAGSAARSRPRLIDLSHLKVKDSDDDSDDE